MKINQHRLADLEEQIQEEIRQKVFEKDSQLKEKLRYDELQEINISVLEEMTEVLTKEDIREISKQVREKFEKKDVNNHTAPFFNSVVKWINLNKSVLISLTLTAFICSYFILQIEDKNSIGGFIFFGFPFIIILFGVVNALTSIFKTK